MRKFVLSFLVMLIFVFIAFRTYNLYLFKKNRGNIYVDEDGVEYTAKILGNSFYLYDGERFNEKFLKGVNLGVGKPGYFPGEFGISKEEYLRWFQQIKDMNADLIRVYITQNLDFYDAFYEFNFNNPDPLYLIHGVWVKDNYMNDYGNAFAEDEIIKNELIADATCVVDVIHGNKTLGTTKYNKDVSNYVIGYILGVEWEPEFVFSTNELYPERNYYDGKYLYTENASPFEVFLCEVSDEVIRYEAEKYNMQRPFAVSNWTTTDPLEHPNEPLEKEDLVSVDVEHIKAKETLKTGLFASYHVYPYYPDFMNYDHRYITPNNDGINSYKAYLKELTAHHTIPVMISELGVPTSRGITHEAKYSGFNQGHVSEFQQGQMICSMVDDIVDAGCIGAIIFTWQDEWFKRTWNTMDLNVPDRRAYWSDIQTSEQYFGLLAFDPGSEDVACYPDGNFGEWSENHIIHERDGMKISFQYDEKYVYFMIEGDFEFETDVLLLPIDVISNQGNTKYNGIEFEKAADFMIRIDGKENSRVLVDPYYETFRFSYASMDGAIETDVNAKTKDSGVFSEIYLALNKGLYLPETKEYIPFSRFETGILKYGNANPGNINYNFLSDFMYSDGKIELRLPWGLLNVSDPSSKQIIADLYAEDGISFIDALDFYIGITREGISHDNTVEMSSFTWDKWDMPTYHERLKQSYYLVQDKFKGN